MSSSELKVRVEEGRFFEKMIVEQKVKSNAFVNDAYNTIEIATRLNCISESSIEDVHIEKIKEDVVKVTIEYRKVLISDLTKSEDMKDKIIAVLKYLEYSEDDIEFVSKCQRVFDIEPTWYVKMRNSYNPDEIMSQRNEENATSKLLSKIFKQKVYFKMG